MVERSLSDKSLEIIALFDKEGIHSFEDLKKQVGKRFSVESGEELRFELVPGRSPSKDYLIRCRIMEKDSPESPIVISMNESEGYSSITIRYEKELEGYKSYFRYPSGNILQERKLPFSFDEILNNLRELSLK
jgi:hypothetical protein